MQTIALIFIVGFVLVFHLYLSFVAMAAASLVQLTIWQWGVVCLSSSFFVVAGIILSAEKEELIINAPKTPIVQDKVERPTNSLAEIGMLGSIWSRTARSVQLGLSSFFSSFDGGTILFLCIVHNGAVWLAVGFLTALFNFRIALVFALLTSVGITYFTRKVRKVGGE